MERKERLVREVRKVLQDQLVVKDYKDQQDRLVRKEQQEFLVRKDLKEHRD
ncbi:MAG: hypothetical protein R1F52_00260 [Candidatus Nitrosoabyssus spongiisocia]|nr:MAG: hypothetical protein R1F52_00260 [Nitrosopumilaceae archaeon AB1(1)]